MCDKCFNRCTNWVDFKTTAKESERRLKNGFGTEESTEEGGDKDIPIVKEEPMDEELDHQEVVGNIKEEKDLSMGKEEQFNCGLINGVSMRYSMNIVKEESLEYLEGYSLARDEEEEEEEEELELKDPLHCDEEIQRTWDRKEGFSQFRSYGAIEHRDVHNDNNEERPFQCDECDRKFKSKYHLQAHKLMHGEKIFKCDLCEKAFTRRKSFQRHKLIHTGVRTFDCGVCIKKFLRKKDLESHQSTHPGFTPFQCDICEKKFNQKGNFTYHLLQHKKPFECDQCKKRFKGKTELMTHQLTHTGGTFECDQCGVNFTSKSTLTRHLKVHYE